MRHGTCTALFSWIAPTHFQVSIDLLPHPFVRCLPAKHKFNAALSRPLSSCVRTNQMFSPIPELTFRLFSWGLLHGAYKKQAMTLDKPSIFHVLGQKLKTVALPREHCLKLQQHCTGKKHAQDWKRQQVTPSSFATAPSSSQVSITELRPSQKPNQQGHGRRDST